MILDELLKDKLQSKVEITKDELDAYYEAHSRELLDPLKIQVSLMLLPNFPAAKDLETQVNHGGSFAAFAKRYSIHEQSKAKGGDLGPYRKGLVIPEVDAVIRTLKPGLISAPIKTESGYYLVMTTPSTRNHPSRLGHPRTASSRTSSRQAPQALRGSDRRYQDECHDSTRRRLPSYYRRCGQSVIS
ncbi:MAG: hypothetical protein HC794_06375 [Nitrospiraceae bacterium]|nr:hypothetical protein [Nitrospiraceae bacterium]